MIPGDRRLSVAWTPLTAVGRYFFHSIVFSTISGKEARYRTRHFSLSFTLPCLCEALNYIFSAKIHKKQKVVLDVFPFHATQAVVDVRQGNKGVELGTTFLNNRNF